jgi:hypothetical protein
VNSSPSSDGAVLSKRVSSPYDSTVARSSIDILQRMENAVEKVRQRLTRAAGALQQARIPYAVVGGNAVAAWVATVDEAGVRNTQDVHIMVRRADFPAVKSVLEGASFVYRCAAGLDLFLDGPAASPRHAVHVIFADELVRQGEPAPNPGIDESTDLGAFRVINLDALVRIKLTAYRDKDRTHLRDLVDIGLIDQSWTSRLPAALAARLQSLLDSPEG